jgi:hypothetical protein
MLGEASERDLWPQRREQHSLLLADQARELQLPKLRLSSVTSTFIRSQEAQSRRRRRESDGSERD